MSQNDKHDTGEARCNLTAVERLRRGRRVERTLIFDVPGHSSDDEPGRPASSAEQIASDYLQSDLSDAAASASDANENRKVAKTMIEGDLHFLDKLSAQNGFDSDDQSPNPGHKPRAAKTMLEADLQFMDNLTAPDTGESDDQSSTPASKPRVPKTMLEADLQFMDNLVVDAEPMADQLPSANEVRIAAELPPADQVRPLQNSQSPVVIAAMPEFAGSAKSSSKRRSSQQFTARTLLDHNMIIETRTQFAVREKRRIEQEVSQRSPEPQKNTEAITARNEVRSCPFSWNDESSKERFKACAMCQATIYNFEDFEPSQAEALILNRENRKKFVLYKRADGKFMTSDCPVAKRRRDQLFGLVAIGVCIIVCVAAVLILMPPPPPPPAVTHARATDSSTTNLQSPITLSHTTSPGTSSKTLHYEAGKPLPTESKPNTSSSQTQKPYTDSEEKGDFWQFQN